MIPVARPIEREALSILIRRDLRRRSAAMRGIAQNDPQILSRWKTFKKSKAHLDLFAALQRSFHGKCVFCERRGAKTIDHYRPKSRFPSRTFRWVNFLLCCFDCNQEKLERFPRWKGMPLLLDPCADDPADFLTWNRETGKTDDTDQKNRASFDRKGGATWSSGRGWAGVARTGGAARHAGQSAE